MATWQPVLLILQEVPQVQRSRDWHIAQFLTLVAVPGEDTGNKSPIVDCCEAVMPWDNLHVSPLTQPDEQDFKHQLQ